MRPGVHFGQLSLIVSTVAILAQFYLFLRIGQAIRASRRSTLGKSWLIGAVGLTIALLFAMNTFIMSRPIPWVDPPAVADVILFYFPAVWTFGSIFSALLLGLAQLLRGLGRLVVLCRRGLDRQKAAAPVNLQRRRFLAAGVTGLAAAPFLLSGYGAAYGGRAYEVRELTLPFGRALRVVHLTDIHAGLYMTRPEIRRYADQINALNPICLSSPEITFRTPCNFSPGAWRRWPGSGPGTAPSPRWAIMSAGMGGSKISWQFSGSTGSPSCSTPTGSFNRTGPLGGGRH